MPLTEKQKKAKRKRYKNASEEEKTNYAKYQKENYKNIAASFKRSEAEKIAAIFAAHNVTPAQVLRGATVALMNGETIRTQSEPLTIPPEYQTAESQASTEAPDSDSTDEPPTT